MKTALFFILTTIAFFRAPAQVDSVFQFDREYSREVVDFNVDNLGNLYILDKADRLKKYNSNGDSVAVFNAVKRFGQLYSIDVTNPLKILLYYKDFGTVLSLDRFLAIRNTIDLRRLNLFQVRSVGLAYDNNIWVFDEQEGKLKRLTEDGRVIQQTNDLRLIFDTLPSPSQIIDQNGLVYLYDPVRGIYVFDYYGTLKTRVPFTAWNDFMVVAGTIYGRKSGVLIKFQPSTLDFREQALPPFMQNSNRVRISQNKMYVLVNGSLKTYRFY